MIKLKTEADAHLVLSWISDISDQKTNKFLFQNGSIATISQISSKNLRTMLRSEDLQDFQLLPTSII